MLNAEEQMDWLERTGAYHIHSRYSDGSASVPEIIAAAREAGLDYMILTDHDTFAARREGWQGRFDGVTVLVGVEITPRYQGHLVAMDVERCTGYAVQPNDRTLEKIAAQGGYAIIAHPLGKRKPSLRIHQRPWSAWTHRAVRGLEIWSYTHDWIDGVAWWRLPEAHEFWRHPERRVRGPDRTLLAKWDRLGRRRRLVGLGSLDCHARSVPIAGIRIFPYARMFRFLRNHLFVSAEAWERDGVAALSEAMREGRGFVAHDIIADTTGTRCAAQMPDGRTVQMGAEARFEPGITMRIELPRPGDIRWLADGRTRLRARGRSLAATPAGPGVYRFEVRLEGRPWIFANPVYLR